MTSNTGSSIVSLIWTMDVDVVVVCRDNMLFDIIRF